MRRYMIVANQTLGYDALVQFVRDRAAAGPSEFWVVVPATLVKHLAARSLPIAAHAGHGRGTVGARTA